MGASVCTADETSLQARCLRVHGGSDVLAGLSSSVYTFIGHSAPKGTISVCTRIEDICGLVGVLARRARGRPRHVQACLDPPATSTMT